METQTNSAAQWQPSWFAVYTRSRHEHAVKTQLDSKGIEGFLPAYNKVSQWKDRRRTIEMPLFPGYLFVKIPPINRLEVLKAFGVVRLVGDGCAPLPVPEVQIQNIHRLLETGFKYDPHPYLQIGRRVRITNGPLSGLEGILARKKNLSRLVVSVDLIERAVSVEIDSWNVERI
ncbi:MAG: UpxY family transcription antiterminator [Acidobacteria bacterium]|nr:UpxY family transcription antiterminator [Acidobacteriota bacterium]MCI0621736.1 UpxY family transcription antiterminator [Acidobacteriota bacterium]MCI0718376.1 UpxY family transcription antiterminator [Acidobacteriota bacterium]